TRRRRDHAVDPGPGRDHVGVGDRRSRLHAREGSRRRGRPPHRRRRKTPRLTPAAAPNLGRWNTRPPSTTATPARRAPSTGPPPSAPTSPAPMATHAITWRRESRPEDCSGSTGG